MSIAVWQFILYLVLTLLAGGALGFYLSQLYFKKYLRGNPPINENMIRAMMMQMGRKPSEKQVRHVMQSMKNAK